MILFVTILHVVLCITLVAVVLVQHGKGADMGVALGGGGSQTIFGARGAGNFLTKLTSGAAALFMATSLYLAYFADPTPTVDLIESEAALDGPALTPSEDLEAVALDEAAAAGGEAEAEGVPSGFEEITPPAPAQGADGENQ